MSDIRETVKQRLSRRAANEEQIQHTSLDALRERSQSGSTWRRPALIWLFAACAPGLIISLGSHFFTVEPLEKRLQEMQVLQTARNVDATVHIRASAVQVAAGGRASANLVQTDELDRLLQGLRSAFPDFLSMEILDEHGEILAMVGELPLSDAVRSVGKSKTAKVGVMSYHDRDLFQDDPEADSFVITARHETEEGRVWFSRTRFARDAIKRALASAPEGTALTLVPLADRENEGLPHAGESQRFARSASIVQLNVPGWAVKVERKATASTFSWGAAIAAGIGILVIGLALAYRRFASIRQLRPMNVWACIQSLLHWRPQFWPRIVPERPKETSSRDPNPKPLHADGQDDESDDTWTPRNAPLSFQVPEVQEISGSALKLYEESYCGCPSQNPWTPLQLTEGESAAALSSESLEDGAVDTGSPLVVAPADRASELQSVDGISEEDVPEILEVSWDEPCDYRPSQFQMSLGKQP